MIFYFSATGNSKYAAEKIAGKTGDRIVFIADCFRKNEFTFEVTQGEIVGFVMPTYYYGLPIMIPEFIEKLALKGPEPYIFSCMTCGSTTGNASGKLEKLLSENGLKLSAKYSVAMADNFPLIYKLGSAEKAAECLKAAEPNIEKICEKVLHKDRGDFDGCKGVCPNIVSSFAYPLYKHGRNTKKFTVNGNCSSCGLCEKICPSNAIEMRDGKPVWIKEKCYLCLGCLNRCPEQAINNGKSAGNGRYVNPNL